MIKNRHSNVRKDTRDEKEIGTHTRPKDCSEPGSAEFNKRIWDLQEAIDPHD